MKTRRHARRLGGGAWLLTALAASCAPWGDTSGNHARAQIRGQIVSATSGQAMDCVAPLVVMAIPAAAASQTPAVLPVIRRVDDAFSPSFVVVPAGRSVHIVNDDDICHSFFSSSEHNAFELGIQRPGESNTIRFESPGPVQVYCKLHTGKQATILVAPTTHFAVVSSSGQFEIDNFEPGTYVLETWNEVRALQQLEVVVPARRTKFVEIAVDELQLQEPE